MCNGDEVQEISIDEFEKLPRKPGNQYKLILLGDEKVGKTSIVERVLFDKFDADKNKATIGYELYNEYD